MPKMKTCKAIAKRVKMTGTGKLMRHRQGKSHLLSTKNAKRRRYLNNATLITGAMAPKIARGLQNG